MAGCIKKQNSKIDSNGCDCETGNKGGRGLGIKYKDLADENIRMYLTIAAIAISFLALIKR